MENKTNLKYSIVVPTYNVEKFISKCIDSLINQTYKNLEIILVDDGSKDSSGTICDSYAIKDNRIKVIHKVNAGLGMARNTGIENATGDYIAFIDGDDIIDCRLIEIADKYLSKKNYDVFCFSSFSFYDENNIEEPKISGKFFEYKNEEVQMKALPRIVYSGNNNEGLNGSACTKIFSMNLIKKNNFKFVSERQFISEDYYSNLLLYKNVKSLVSIPDNMYFYRQNNTSSLTSIYRTDRFEKNVFQYYESFNLANEYNYNDEVKNNLAFQFFSNTLGTFQSILNQQSLSKKDKKKILKDIIENEDFNYIIKQLISNNEKLHRKVLIFCLKHKMVWASITMLKIKHKLKGNKK